MRIYRIAKRAWYVLPQGARRALWSASPRWVRAQKVRAKNVLSKGAEHDDVYDRAYYEELVDPLMVKSAPIIADSIMESMSPSSIVDVGCGTGALLAEFQRRGVRCAGLERSEAGIEICRARDLDVRYCDLEADDPIESPIGRTDVIVSLEVAEHLPERVAARFVKTLAALGQRIVMSAAEPTGVPGHDHVNEKPREYWIDLLKKAGYRYDEALTREWAATWEQRGVEGCYYKNVMIFETGSG